MNAASVLEKVKGKYKTLTSYSDKGRVTRSPDAAAEPIEFKTYFMQPRNFRFEWCSWHPYFGKKLPEKSGFICSNDHNSHFAHDESRPEKISEKKAFALAAVHSGGSAHMILNLLIPGCVNVKNYWSDYIEYISCEDAFINELECYQLLGKDGLGSEAEIWISKKDCLVRKIITSTIVTTEIAEAGHQKMIENLKQSGIDAEYYPTAPQRPDKYNVEFLYTEVTTELVVPLNLFVP